MTPFLNFSELNSPEKCFGFSLERGGFPDGSCPSFDGDARVISGKDSDGGYIS